MSRPVYAIAPDETTNQALARLGFKHQRCVGFGGEVVRVSDGYVMHYSKDVRETNRWIEAGCPDCNGKAMPELDHSASDFEVSQ